jgi:hypothetical protein
MSHSDNPRVFRRAEDDWLGRWPAVAAFKQLLDGPGLQTPLVVGIYGGWGSGKTSMMQTLAEEIDRADRVLLWFDAWVYARQERSLWRALLLRVIEELHRQLGDRGASEEGRKDATRLLDEARASLYRSLMVAEKGVVRVNWWGGLPLVADTALTALTAGLSKEIAKAVSDDKSETGLVAAVTKWVTGDGTREAVKLIEREASERHVEQLVSLEQFKKTFDDLLKQFGIGAEQRLFVFVDDLDRCLPEDAVAALEAIKLFLDLPGCVFVLGMDRSVVEQGIRVRYQKLMEQKAGFDPRAYLDKNIQLPFILPPLGSRQIGRYLDELSKRPGHAAGVLCHDLIEAAAPRNPRALKRVLNILQLTLYLDGITEADIDALTPSAEGAVRVRHIAKLVLLQAVFNRAYAVLAPDPSLLKEVENFVQRRQSKLADPLKPTFEVPDLERLLKLQPFFNGLGEDEIDDLFGLSKVTASARAMQDTIGRATAGTASTCFT